MVADISLPIGQQHSEEKPHFATAGGRELHHLRVSEGSPMLSLAHEGLKNSHALPRHRFGCSWFKQQGQGALQKVEIRFLKI